MDKSTPVERTQKKDTETSIRVRVQNDIKERLNANKVKAGFKSLSQFLIFRGLEEPPARKAPTKERLALIKGLANLGHILTELRARPDDTSHIEAQITAIASKVHENLDNDSQG